MSLQLPARAEARVVRLNGAALHYWEYSPADPSRPDPTIVMVHGFRGDHHGLLKLVDRLPQARLIVPDLPGFGQSAPLIRGAHDVQNYADVVDALLRRLELAQDTVLLGHSFGSIIVSRFAAEHAGRVRALILINPICEPALEGSKALLSELTGLYYLACARLPEGAGLYLLRHRLIVRVMSELMVRTRDEQLRRWIHAEHGRYFSAFANRSVVLEAFRASIGGTVRSVAEKLTMPVLLIAAADDDLGSIAGQRALAAAFPDARLEMLDGVGHLIHYEKPDEAAALTTDFLQHLPSGGVE